MSLDRRSFLAATAGALAGGSLTSCSSQPDPENADAVAESRSGPLLVATWPFGKGACARGLEVMQAGGTPLDGVEQGIRLIETIGNGSVGLSGRPNAAGYTELDACIMDGRGHRAGAVAAVEGIVHPITAARRVMEHSKHVMLVGEGARWFALEHGLESVDVADHAAMKAAWMVRERGTRPDRQPASAPVGHDTIALLALGENGDVAGGCSTSGAGHKLPGRVGDSPILGAGLYVDNEVGAAGATGLGENIMRYSATAMVVELMRRGNSPTEACEEVIHRMATTDPLGYELAACFIALDLHGRFGAAASNQQFPFAVATPERCEVLRVQRVARRS